ncbi:NAD(P)-binding protein [Auriscalpium vulgare]|uniref:NAD(P)-binding protein n=1 Tax=Auriscalpium vulgare TaxID=40419 RepID=A0ACB8S8U9_9AGAM|nr:NAD(P)-binding protein [Auriscalpium vulgare]
MPAITSGKVLVTGASGYIGAWLVKYLVKTGFSVVVATRNDEQAAFIETGYEGKVTHVNVPDIQKEGAYDEAVRGVDAIVHSASPLTYSWKDPSEVTGPAIAGAIGILKSAHKYGTNVKRVVLTASVVGVHNHDYGGEQKPDTTYDETNWNTTAMNAGLDKDSSPILVYHASKTRAERAAWDFIKAEKPSFDLVTILPGFNFGPFIHKNLSSTPGLFLSMFPTGDTSGKVVGDWVDVRDTATLHVLALQKESLAGERLAAVNGLFAWQDLYDIFHAAGYDAPGKDTKGAGAKKQNTPILNDKTFKFFPEFKYRSLDVSIKDMAVAFKTAGLIN